MNRRLARLITTFGLRVSEVALMELGHIDWRREHLRVWRPKMRDPLVLPLTGEVAEAIAHYLRDGRPITRLRALFLTTRSPLTGLAPCAVGRALRRWARRAGLPASHLGAHCLRHSLAVYLLRQGVSLKVIGDVLGHRNPQSTCAYLRLNVDDLRDVGLEVPSEALP